MVKYCDQCGEKLDNDAQFCNKCGTQVEDVPEETKSLFNKKTVIILLIVIIILLSMLIFVSGALDFRKDTNLTIQTTSPMTDSDTFNVVLNSSEDGISGKTIKITFKNDKNTYNFTAKTNQNGIASITPSVEIGDYDVICEFEGDSDYKPDSATKDITVKKAEPNYQAYSYSNSFEDTDTDGDGYVLLSDMNIAHTPENIQNQMFAESDDDGDGRLNHDEYYKFMYKLNYDRHSYGL